MLAAALRRLAFISVVAVGVTVLVSLFIGLLAGSGVARALTLGFYFVGSFLLISGFFVGNRGPVRVKQEEKEQPGSVAGATAAPMIFPIPGFSGRKLRWASAGEQHETINNSAIFIVLGLLLVFIGVAFDSKHSLF
jgi:uncharacterized membrane protein